MSSIARTESVVSRGLKTLSFSVGKYNHIQKRPFGVWCGRRRRGVGREMVDPERLWREGDRFWPWEEGGCRTGVWDVGEGDSKGAGGREGGSC